MSQPLIIFGAGASYDYSIECQRPEDKISPLTQDLAHKDFLMNDLLERYIGSGDLLNEIVLQVRNGKMTFEEALTATKERMGHSKAIRSQFVALEFYLQELFKRISDPQYTRPWVTPDDRGRMAKMNNYRSIINRINTYNKGVASIVTFNYDTLFEDALGTMKPQNMNEYIQNEKKIFKLHGSHDWAYLYRRSSLHSGQELDAFAAATTYPDLFEKVQNSPNDHQPFHLNEIRESSEAKEFYLFPALAIPLIGKEKYVCPKFHTEKLQTELMNIDRILIIGWRAVDILLLEMMRDLLPKTGYDVTVVSGSLDSAKEIAKRIQMTIKCPPQSIKVYGGGFSGFMSDNLSHEFFS